MNRLPSLVAFALLAACGSTVTAAGDAGDASVTTDAADASDVVEADVTVCPDAETDRKPSMFIGTKPICQGCPPLLSANTYDGKPCGTAAPSCLMSGPAWAEILACCPDGIWRSKPVADGAAVNPCK